MNRLLIPIALNATAAALTLSGCGSTPGSPESVPATTAAERPALNLPVPVELGRPFVVTDLAGAELTRVTIHNVEVDPSCPQGTSYAQPPKNGHYLSVEMEVETLPEFSTGALTYPGASDFEIRDGSGYTERSMPTDPQRCLVYDQIFKPMTAGNLYHGWVLLDTKQGASELIYKPGPTTEPGWVLRVNALATKNAELPPTASLEAPMTSASAESTRTPLSSPRPPASASNSEGLDTTIGDGTFVVGIDAPPGTYSTEGPRTKMGMCAFTFLPYKGASLSEASGGNSLAGPGYMHLTQGQIVQTLGCTWNLEE